MHIPDGFLSPQTYLPAYALAAGAWAWAGRNLKYQLNEATVPRLAMLTALAYGLSLIMLPLPGGTSGHAVGVALLALIFGIRAAFVTYSIVLLLQALLLGAGGITALAINALSMGLFGAAIAVAVKRSLSRAGDTLAVGIAAWLSVVLPSAFIALVLGIQPLIARREDGAPLFFPFDLSITLPAIVLPHLIIGIGEAVFTVLVWRYAKDKKWV